MKHLTLAAACVALLAAPAWGDWSDNFQSYAIDSLLSGQGGWAGWNGGVATSTAVADPAGTAGNVVAKLNQNDDLVQEYSGYTSGAWVYTAKQYIPSGQHGQERTYFILMNKYSITPDSKGWAVSLEFDLNLDVVWDHEAAEGYIPIVYDAWTEIRVEIDLDANVRTVYYNGTKVGFGVWYGNQDGNHAKSIAALDLWADAGGNPVYYDDISLVPGTPVPPPADPATDITTNGIVDARYLVALGQGYGDTVETVIPWPTGALEIASGGGNQNAWWRLNDGETRWVMCTYGAPGPDYFGYKFKLPATVTHVVWWNYVFWDGGTFAAPELQYLDAPGGTWHTVTNVTWDKPYDNVYNHGNLDVRPLTWGARRYVITLSSPPANVWGIRLYGDAQPGSDDFGNIGTWYLPGTGFVAVNEMTLYGAVNVGTLDLSNNLALGVNGGAPIASYCQQAAAGIARINDGLFVDSGDSFGTVSATGEEYIGVTWTEPRNNVAAVGMTFAGFRDGGYLGHGICEDEPSFRIEYTTDGTNWAPVTGLDKGIYPDVAQKLQSLQWGPDAAFLFRFNPVSGITGIRIIGDPDGYVAGGAGNGFLGWLEFEVFANSSGGKPQAEATTREFLPSLESLAGKTLGQLRTTKLF